MTVYDSTTLATLTTGAHARRPFVYVRGKDSGGSAKTFGFWGGLGTVSVTVVSAVDGSSESRSYKGDGALIGIDSVVYSLGLDVRTIDCTLSQIHADVQDMVRANDIRHALVEVHVGILDAATGALVAAPLPYWLGYVDGAPVETPADGGEGAITLKMVSASVDLTRVNSATKGDEYQKLRSTDRYFKWADAAGGIKVVWGQERA